MAETRYRRILLWVVISYCLITTFLSILRFRAYNDGLVDLGRMEQAIWNIILGGWPINTFEFGNAPRFIVHCEPILFLLSPFYLIFQHTEFLLAVQSFALGLAALPLYKISLRELKDERTSLIISFAYLLYPSLFCINMIDFHPDSFAILFIFCAFYFLINRKWRWFWGSIFLVLSIREYFGLIIAFLGGYLFMEYKDKKRGLILVLLGTSWFLFAYFVLPRMFWQFWSWRSHIGPLTGSSFQIKGLLKNIAALLLPVAFLPLLGLRRLLIALPILGASILVGQFFYGTHHVAGVIPFIFLATISGVKYLSDRKNKQLGIVLILATLFANQLYGGGPISIRFYLSHDYHYWKNEHNFGFTKHDAILDKFVKLIPTNAVLSASNHIGANLARREYINFFPYPQDLSKVDYILADLKIPNSIPWLKWNEQIERIENLKQNANFILLKQEDKVYLFQRKTVD